MASLPSGYSIRRIELKDYKDVVETLNVLTTVGDISQSEFASIVEYWNTVTISPLFGDGKDQNIYKYNPYVITDGTDRVVATGNVIIERKVIHRGGLVGHIEDIAVAKDQQGKKLGLILIQQLSEVAKEAGCYKVILDCDEKNVGFYEKCGYKRAGVEMDLRFWFLGG